MQTRGIVGRLEGIKSLESCHVDGNEIPESRFVVHQRFSEVPRRACRVVGGRGFVEELQPFFGDFAGSEKSFGLKGAAVVGGAMGVKGLERKIV